MPYVMVDIESDARGNAEALLQMKEMGLKISFA